MGIMDF